jgi:hypothetical protein
VRPVTAFDGTEDDVVAKWQFGHWTAVRMSVIVIMTILYTALPFCWTSVNLSLRSYNFFPPIYSF